MATTDPLPKGTAPAEGAGAPGGAPSQPAGVGTTGTAPGVAAAGGPPPTPPPSSAPTSSSAPITGGGSAPMKPEKINEIFGSLLNDKDIDTPVQNKLGIQELIDLENVRKSLVEFREALLKNKAHESASEFQIGDQKFTREQLAQKILEKQQEMEKILIQLAEQQAKKGVVLEQINAGAQKTPTLKAAKIIADGVKGLADKVLGSDKEEKKEPKSLHEWNVQNKPLLDEIISIKNKIQQYKEGIDKFKQEQFDGQLKGEHKEY